MREQMEARLKTLKTEYEKGQSQLRQLELQVSSLRETLLRINGATLVLEEILSLPASLEIVDEPTVPADTSDDSKSVTSAA